MVEVNHLHAHVLAHFIEEEGEEHESPEFPFLCLLVSGGNSQIILVRSASDMEIIGQTIDDAAGEAFDKCAKVMGLGYPGGPVVNRLANEGDILMKKLRLAAKDLGIRQVAVAGGVSANTGLREAFHDHARRYGWKVFIPKFAYTTDNAAMVAMNGYYSYLEGLRTGLDAVPFARVTM